MAGGSAKPAAGSPDSRAGSSSIWPLIEAAVLDQVLAHRSTIVFVNSRGLCEKLTARLNELYAKRRGLLPGGPEGGVAAGGQDALPGGPDVSGASTPPACARTWARRAIWCRAPSTS